MGNRDTRLRRMNSKIKDEGTRKITGFAGIRFDLGECGYFWLKKVYPSKSIALHMCSGLKTLGVLFPTVTEPGEGTVGRERPKF